LGFTEKEGGVVYWFLRLVLVVLPVIRRDRAKHRDPRQQDKLDQIFVHMRNQECESKGLQKHLETHSKKMINVRKETKNIKDNWRRLAKP
jgi:hypothetical protein